MTDSSKEALEKGESLLVAEAKAGGTAAFEELVGRYKEKIYRLGLNITGSPEDGEDILQETFLKAFEHIRDFREGSLFYTWIVRIAINEGLMMQRKRHSEMSVPIEVTIGEEGEVVPSEFADRRPNPEQLFAQAEQGAILENAAWSLPPQFHAVFFLRYVKGLSMKETAAMLHVAVGTVKARIYRTHRRLRLTLAHSFG